MARDREFRKQLIGADPGPLRTLRFRFNGVKVSLDSAVSLTRAETAPRLQPKWKVFSRLPLTRIFLILPTVILSTV